MKLLVEDLTTPKAGRSLSEMLASKGTVHISQGQWELINQAEVAAGEPLGKPRVKFTDRNKMLGFAG
jgi:ferredoxin--NADP+ reductase